jgi:hypothetical protein
VDIGYFFVVRNQLQNATDAAALAGAQGLLADPGNFSSTGQAMTLATQVAAQNRAAGQAVTLAPSEITFPKSNTVRVTITRPAPTFFGRVLSVQSVNIQVTATAVVARISPTGGVGGMRPWAILDQFGHGFLCVPPNDEDINSPPHGEFKETPHTWMGVPVSSDHYQSPYDSSFDNLDLSREGDCGMVTGLIASRDVTNQLVYLKEFKNGPNPWRTPGNYGAAALGGRGASNYEDNIINGYDGAVRIGDVLDTEPGNMTGPTRSGVNALIAMDPTAHMVRNSAGKWVVVSSTYPINESPRIVPIPMYSVYTAPDNGRSTFTVTSIASFFIVGTDGKDVWGKFVQSRVKNAYAGKPVPGAVGAAGQLVGTVKLVAPE